jgi:hypothetical protein
MKRMQNYPRSASKFQLGVFESMPKHLDDLSDLRNLVSTSQILLLSIR